jgi:hypothetical protein
MKKTLLLIASTCVASLLLAQTPCSDAFISEMVEGWSNNKAIEIYNPTDQPLNISTYGLARFQNGSSNPGSFSYFTGITIAAHDVFVVVIDKRDTSGTGQEAPVWDELQAKADTFINPTYDNGIWPMYFNGNDAVALAKNNGNVLVDLFGKPGEGANFGGWNAYGTDAQGNTLYMSADHTIIRKYNVTSGVTTVPSSFDLTIQWDTLPANTFDSLGVHHCLCGTVGVNELFQNEDASARIFPNPIQDGFLSVVANERIDKIMVFDMNGKMIRQEFVIYDRMHRLDVAALQQGVYSVVIQLGSGKAVTRKFVK